jgi:hypothetical protein
MHNKYLNNDYDCDVPLEVWRELEQVAMDARDDLKPEGKVWN